MERKQFPKRKKPETLNQRKEEKTLDSTAIAATIY
jgi:hypothetical protein